MIVVDEICLLPFFLHHLDQALDDGFRVRIEDDLVVRPVRLLDAVAGTLILDWAEANARGGGGARARRAPAAQARLYGLHVREDAGGRWRWHRGSDVILRPFANDAEVEAALSRLGVYMPRGADTLTWSKDGKLAVIREFGVEPAVRLVARA